MKILYVLQFYNNFFNSKYSRWEPLKNGSKIFEWNFYFDDEHVQTKIYVTWSDHKYWDFKNME